MPALRLFGRRWLLAGDDIPLPAAFLAIFHFVWLILLTAWLARLDSRDDCQGVGPYRTAVGGLISAFALSWAFEVAALAVSMRGAMFETNKRAALSRIIYAIIFCVVCQIAFNVYATYLIMDEPPTCEEDRGALNPVNVMKGLVWSTWAVIIGLIVVFIGAYNLFPDYKDPQQWEQQCACLGLACCCSGLRRKGIDPGTASRRLGSIFALMFSHIDVTPTDLLAAVGLVLSRQRAARHRNIKNELRRRQSLARPQSGTVVGASLSRRDSRVGSVEQAKMDAALDAVVVAQHDKDGGQVVGLQGTNDEATQVSPSPPRAPSSSTPEGGASPSRLKRGSPSSGDGLLRDVDVEMGALSSSAKSVDKVFSPSAAARIGGVARGDGRRPDVEQALEDDSVDAATLVEAAHYMKFAFAAYGWMLFVWSRKTAGVVQLCCGRACGLWTSVAARRHGIPIVSGLHAAYMNSEAILQAAGLKERDLLYVRFEGQQRNVLPYYLAVDHSTRSVIMAIRGSLSLDDCVRDLLFEPADLDEWIDGADVAWNAALPPVRPATPSSRFAAHSGIFEAARATLEDARVHGGLADIMSGQKHVARSNVHRNGDHDNDAVGSSSHEGYRLVVCGHSLGAGCAFLISLYLRRFFPTLRCFAFSPPGGLATADLCAASMEWCTSTVCGKEMVPRLTLVTFERLRDELIHCATFCCKPKLHLLIGWLLGRKWSDNELFYDPETLPEEPRRWLESYMESLEATASRRAYVESAGKFGPPGRVIHLQPTGFEGKLEESFRASDPPGKKRKKRFMRQYRAVYVDGQSIVDHGIIVSGRVMADHMPDYCLGLLRRLARSAQEGRRVAEMGDSAGEKEVEGRVSLEAAELHRRQQQEGQHGRAGGNDVDDV